jgi:nucleoside-diphosphate-sugar epimerase
MVLGTGLLASGFRAYHDDDHRLIFASGVSNSINTDVKAFVRERDLLTKTIDAHQNRTFTYFSTCGVYDPSICNTPYVLHKLEMEAVLREKHPDYHIFRISNIAGRSANPHTILNYLVDHIKTGLPFLVWKNASRNIIGIDDTVAICDHIIQQQLFRNDIVNIGNSKNYEVMQIIHAIEEIFSKKGSYELQEKGSGPLIETEKIQSILSDLQIDFDEAYLNRMLQKYFL